MRPGGRFCFRVEARRPALYCARVSPSESNPSPLTAPVTTVWGVGSERARQLARLDIFTVEDLLLHKPRRYEDRRKFLPIRELNSGEPATVRGKIIAAGRKNFRKGARSMFECILDDGTAHLYWRWWQAQPWMEDYYVTGREFLVFGKTDSLRPRTFDHPETELARTRRRRIHPRQPHRAHPSAHRRFDRPLAARTCLARAGKV